MRKLLTTTLALLAGVTLALGAALPASAGSRGNDAPPPTSTETKPAVAPQVEVVWLLPETVTVLPTGNTPAIWPQTHLVDGIVPCERFGQADIYTVEDAAMLTADGVLTEGEDYDHVISWRFIAGPACPIETTVSVTAVHEVCDGAAGTITLTGEHVTWQIVNDFETPAGPAGTVISGVPSGTYNALLVGDAAESAQNHRVYGHTVFTAIPDAGFTVTGEAEFTVDSAPAVCAVTSVTPPTLASTGVMSGWLFPAGGALVLAGGLLFSLARRFRVVAESGE